MYELFANFTLIIHLIFILFVIFGGLLFFKFPKVLYAHFPSFIWGVYIEFSSFVCPLTYLEKWLLNRSNLNSYSNTFIQNYILPVIYPDNLTYDFQIFLGLFLIIINVVIYSIIIFKVRKKNNKK